MSVLKYDALQKVIGDMKSRLKDPDLARLFENTFPNTLGRLNINVSIGLTSPNG